MMFVCPPGPGALMGQSLGFLSPSRWIFGYYSTLRQHVDIFSSPFKTI